MRALLGHEGNARDDAAHAAADETSSRGHSPLGMGRDVVCLEREDAGDAELQETDACNGQSTRLR